MKPLTSREIEAIGYIMKGIMLTKAGHAMGITERTVRFHLDNARRKLKCVNLPHLVAVFIAMQQREQVV